MEGWSVTRLRLVLIVLWLLLCGCRSEVAPSTWTMEAHDLYDYVSDKHIVWREL
jgi:hypothetical protein